MKFKKCRLQVQVDWVTYNCKFTIYNSEFTIYNCVNLQFTSVNLQFATLNLQYTMHFVNLEYSKLYISVYVRVYNVEC